MEQAVAIKAANPDVKNWVTPGLLVVAVALANVSVMADLGNLSRFGFLALTIIGVLLRSWDAFPALLLFFLMGLYWKVVPTSLKGLPSLPFLLPFLASAALVSLHPATRKSLSWMRLGKVDRVSAILLVLTGVASTSALLAWAFWTDNLGIGVEMVKGFASVPLWLLLVVGIPGFALVNSLAEEVVYRGVLQESLARTTRHQFFVLVLQGSAFAAIHYAAGFPNGAMGYLMVFVYGTMLGYLRYRTQGMLAPYLAHVIADLCIGYFLVSQVV